MNIVILAGGFGTRLAEETDVRPKPMVEIGGYPILWHLMKLCADQDFSKFYIALGYKGDKSSEKELLRYLYDEDEGVRIYAVSALAKIMGKDAASPLLELSSRDPSNEVFYQIVEALIEQQCPEVVEAVIKYMCFNLDKQLALIRLPALLDLFEPSVKNEGMQKAFADNETMNRFTALVQLGIAKMS